MHTIRRSSLRAFTLACLSWVAFAQEDARHDPFEGMDPNGRIVRPELPADLPNPERWRYTPPGRIAPGGILRRFLVSSFFSPILFREDDIGTGGGIALTDTDFRNQNYQEFAGIVLSYTTEGQQAYTINWQRWLNHRELENGGIIREDRSILFGGLGYTKTLTRRFYGLGSRSHESAETSYTDERSRFGLGLRMTVPDPGDNLIVGGAIRFQHHELDRGRVSDVPSTNVAFPGAFRRGDDIAQLWIDVGAAYDSRDSLHQPYGGSRIGLAARTAALQTGGDLGGNVTFDAQTIVPVPPLFHRGGNGDEENPPTDVLALGIFIADSFGHLPFYDLPSLGGSGTLRGYTPNRFTDRAAAHGTVEYRFGVIPRGFRITERIRVERIGLALFYDFGTVGHGIDDLDDGRFLDSFGIGARVSFSREASFRVDYGISDEGGNLTIGFGNTL